MNVVLGKRLDNSPYELHIFCSAACPNPEDLVQTYGPADRQRSG